MQRYYHTTEVEAESRKHSNKDRGIFHIWGIALQKMKSKFVRSAGFYVNNAIVIIFSLGNVQKGFLIILNLEKM